MDEAFPRLPMRKCRTYRFDPITCHTTQVVSQVCFFLKLLGQESINRMFTGAQRIGCRGLYQKKLLLS
jgi:hypothetical protein